MNNKALRSYPNSFMLAIAGQTARPNWLIFKSEPMVP